MAMTKRFGETIDSSDAYNTARGATRDMSDAMLARQAGQQNGPEQVRAIADEQAERSAK